MKDSNASQEKIENEFLSLLFLQTDKVYKLLQIKPIYLLNPINQKIFSLIKECYENDGIVSGSYIINGLEPYELDAFAELNDADIVMPSEIEKHFIKAQEIIFERYKSKIQADLIAKFNTGKMTRDEFATKTNLLQEIMFRKYKGKMTKEELTAVSKEKRICLTKFKQLDRMLQLRQKDFLVIGAKTGTGKSSFMLNLMMDLMKDYQCLYLNMEMSPETVKDRIKAIVANVPVDNVSAPSTDYQKSLIDKAIDTIIESGVYFEHETTELDEIENYIKSQKALDKRHTIVFLDHVGLIGMEDSKNAYEKTTSVMKKLRKLCFKFDCTIIAASQLNRTSYSADELDISMLKDSGEVENSASKVILLYRNKDYAKEHLEPEMFVKIAKNRDGIEGKITTTYYKVKQTFEEKW